MTGTEAKALITLTTLKSPQRPHKRKLGICNHSAGRVPTATQYRDLNPWFTCHSVQRYDRKRVTGKTYSDTISTQRKRKTPHNRVGLSLPLSTNPPPFFQFHCLLAWLKNCIQRQRTRIRGHGIQTGQSDCPEYRTVRREPSPDALQSHELHAEKIIIVGPLGPVRSPSTEPSRLRNSTSGYSTGQPCPARGCKNGGTKYKVQGEKGNNTCKRILLSTTQPRTQLAPSKLKSSRVVVAAAAASPKSKLKEAVEAELGQNGTFVARSASMLPIHVLESTHASKHARQQPRHSSVWQTSHVF
ncbi:hypothetical protein QBC37DRAFT_486966 [Rhypophila decipiens]|uniref:Uncharacterized protein n=1 Tax=Rhypophila decipiens TaxID=261697 RepID=A0AAN7B4V6_9PEZI|nr:hypothetical protein QBC37DRAFT_486966 [Rhypophila decipiens]